MGLSPYQGGDGGLQQRDHCLLCGKKLALQVEAASFPEPPAVLSGEYVYVCT